MRYPNGIGVKHRDHSGVFGVTVEPPQDVEDPGPNYTFVKWADGAVTQEWNLDIESVGKPADPNGPEDFVTNTVEGAARFERDRASW